MTKKIESILKPLVIKTAKIWQKHQTFHSLLGYRASVDIDDMREFIRPYPALYNLFENDINDMLSALSSQYSEVTLEKKIVNVFRKMLASELGVQKFDYKKLPYCLFKYDSGYNQQYRESVDKRSFDTINLPKEFVKQWFEVANNLLKDDGTDNYTIARYGLGIAMLTGRRLYSEVLGTLQIFPLEDDDGKLLGTVDFEGLRKGKQHKLNSLQDIPIYGIDLDELTAKHEELKGLLRQREWFNVMDFETTQSNLKNYIGKIFKDEIMSILFTDSDLELTPHDCRKIAVAVYLHCANITGFNSVQYGAKYLGHYNSQGHTDTQTSKSYMKFSIGV